MTECEHCLTLRELLAATNAELGRPLDSFDHDRHALQRSAFPTLADVEACECRCHAHLRFGRRP
jgi:hypothetical protein